LKQTNAALFDGDKKQGGVKISSVTAPMQDGKSKAPAPNGRQQPLTVVACGEGDDATMRGASQSSESCLRRQRCDPAQDSGICYRMADFCGPIFWG